MDKKILNIETTNINFKIEIKTVLVYYTIFRRKYGKK